METGQAFVKYSATLLESEFLPRVRIAVSQLTDEQIWWRPNEASNSIGNLLLHLSGNVRQWIISGVGGAPDERQRQQEFDARSSMSASELLAGLQETVAQAVRVLKNLNVSQLSEHRSIQGNNVPVLEAIYHVVEHFSMHTGQILLLTKMITAKDLQLYEFPGGAAKKRW